METKKSSRANLENKRFLFVEVGLAVSLALVLMAFQSGSSTRTTAVLPEEVAEVIAEDDIPVTMDTPPAPPAAPVFFSDVIDIVTDEIPLDDDFVSFDESTIEVPVMDYIEAPVEEEVDEEPVVFVAVEEKPRFNGGDANEFGRWVAQHLDYPEIARSNGVQGKVILSFVIAKDGSLTDVKVLRGVDSSLDKEAVRVVTGSPKWTPGKQRDRAVPVSYTFPVIFQLK